MNEKADTMTDLAQTVIDDLRQKLVEGFPAQVRAALETLSDEQIWSRPNPRSNSIGNLVIHLCGSTRLFLGKGIGGSDFVRDRPAEFAEKEPVPKAELLRQLDATVKEVEALFAALTPAGLIEVTDRLDKPYAVVYLLLRQSHHWAAHAGQIVWAAKAFRQGAFDELWSKTMK